MGDGTEGRKSSSHKVLEKCAVDVGADEPGKGRCGEGLQVEVKSSGGGVVGRECAVERV